MNILEKYNTIRARNIHTIEQAKKCYFEANKDILIRIDKAEALRLEQTFSSVVVGSVNGSAFLKSRINHA